MLFFSSICIVPFRIYVLPVIFTQDELHALDTEIDMFYWTKVDNIEEALENKTFLGNNTSLRQKLNYRRQSIKERKIRDLFE